MQNAQRRPDGRQEEQKVISLDEWRRRRRERERREARLRAHVLALVALMGGDPPDAA